MSGPSFSPAPIKDVVAALTAMEEERTAKSITARQSRIFHDAQFRGLRHTIVPWQTLPHIVPSFDGLA